MLLIWFYCVICLFLLHTYLLCSFRDSAQYVVSIGVLNPNFKQRLDAEYVSWANAISCESRTALKGTSGWSASLLLPSLKQRWITAIAFGGRWFSMELDALYGTWLGTVWQCFSSCYEYSVLVVIKRWGDYWIQTLWFWLISDWLHALINLEVVYLLFPSFGQ